MTVATETTPDPAESQPESPPESRVDLTKARKPDLGPEIPPRQPPPGPPPPWLRWLDLGMRVLGFVLAVLLTVLTGLFEAFFSSLYWGEYRVPVSIVAAVVVNLGLIWFTVVVTGRRLPVAAIAVVWMAVMVVGSSRTGEGDLVLTDVNWVGIVTMLAGSLTYAVAGYRLVLTAFRPKL